MTKHLGLIINYYIAQFIDGRKHCGWIGFIRIVDGENFDGWHLVNVY